MQETLKLYKAVKVIDGTYKLPKVLEGYVDQSLARLDNHFIAYVTEDYGVLKVTYGQGLPPGKTIGLINFAVEPEDFIIELFKR